MAQKIRILNLEDKKYDSELIHSTLEEEGLDCEITRVETRDGFTGCLKEGKFDLILADYSLPSFDGLTALLIAKEICPDVPLIFVTGTMGEEVAIEALKHGATDYVLKDRLSRLMPAATRALKEAEDKRERKKAEAELGRTNAEIYDLYNNAPCGYHLLDMDGMFVRINDTELS